MDLRIGFYFFCIISVAIGQFDSNPFLAKSKCSFTFLIESAICSDASSMREISWNFRNDWKHIQIVSTTGTFTLAGSLP